MALTRVQQRDLRLLAGFRGVSIVGDEVALVTLYLRVAHGGQGWMIAALAVAGALPLVALAPLAGSLVDRLPARALLACLGVGEGLVCAGLGLEHGDAATIALMALLTCGVAVSTPGYSALVPTITGEENIAAGQSVLQSVQGVGLVMGPALGGLLVAALGQSGPLFLDGASFALAALGTLALRTDRRPDARSAAGEAARRWTDGFRHVFADPFIRPVTVTATTVMLSIGAVNVAEVFFITRTLHGSALDYGLAGTSFGLGSVAGALAARRLRQAPLTLVRATLLGIFIAGVALGVVGLIEHVGLLFPLMVVTGVTIGVVNVAATTLYALRTPDELRGRAFAATGALFTSAQLTSMVLGGALLGVVAPRTVFQMAGVLATVSVGVVAPLELRTSRRADLAIPQGD